MSFIIDFSAPTFSKSSVYLSSKVLLATLICTFVLLVHVESIVAAKENGNSEKQSNSSAKPDNFEYVLESRPDPFEPFITEKAATSSVDMNEIIDDENPLTGMQLFEPGQLNLVALMKKGPEDIAMVEDFTGKGYILNEGTKIGRRGVVKDIALNKVLIEETAITRAGKKLITEVVMLLKKEGEE